MKISHVGKSAIVTGGSRGIGRAIAHELVGSGARVMITGRQQSSLESTAEELGPGCFWQVCHVADAASAQQCVAAAVDLFGGIDLLVNNAAVNPQWGPTLRVDAAMAAKMAEVNHWAPLMWSRLVFDASMRARGGSILNVSSIGGMIVSPHTGYYNSTKAALNYLTRQLANELAPKVRVNAVAPGLVETEMMAEIPIGDREQLIQSIPMARLGRPRDIAAAASFLLSDQAQWVTGSILVVDGGARDARGA